MELQFESFLIFVISVMLSEGGANPTGRHTEMNQVNDTQSPNLMFVSLAQDHHTRRAPVGRRIYLQYDGSEYFGEVTIGTPAKTVYVIFDTGSSDMWLLSKRFDIKLANPHHNFYDYRRSATYERDGTKFAIKYVTGSASGILSREKVVLAGLPAKHQTFAEVEHVHPAFKRMKYDGLIGMGFSSLTRTHASVPMDTLHRSGVLEERIFSFCLHPPRRRKQSVLIIGGSDDRLYHPPLHYIPLSRAKFWQFDVQQITIGRKVFAHKIQAILDSGTSLITGPPDKIHELHHKYLKGKNYKNGGTYLVRCGRIRRMPAVTFQMTDIDGKLRSFEMEPHEYIRKGIGGTYCTSGFQGITSKHHRWILGQLFMQKFYSKFDMDRERVGMATVKV